MIANLLLGISFVLLPLYVRIPYVGNGDARTCRDLLALSLLPFITIFLKGIKRHIGFYFLAVVAYFFLALFLNQYRIDSNSVMLTTIIASVWASFTICFMTSHDYNTRKYLLIGMSVGAILQSIVGVCGYFGHQWYFDFVSIFRSGLVLQSPPGGPNAVTGSLDNNNLFGSYVAISSIAIMSNKNFKGLIIIPILALLLSNCWMGIGAFVAGMFYLYNSEHNMISKAKLYTLAIISMIVLPFFDIRGADSGRFQVWRDMISRADFQHWTIGFGPGWFPDSGVYIVPGSPMAQEHNSFLTIFNTFGLVGFLLLLPIFVKFLNTKDRDPVFAAILFAAFCNSWGHFTIQQSTAMIIIIPVMCICVGQQYDVKKE